MHVNILLLIRPIILEYGLWDEVRVDQGKEWVLSLYVQEQLAPLRTNTARPPHLQSTSKKVRILDYFWMLGRNTYVCVCNFRSIFSLNISMYTFDIVIKVY